MALSLSQVRLGSMVATTRQTFPLDTTVRSNDYEANDHDYHFGAESRYITSWDFN